MKELKIIATIVAKSETNKEIYASLLKVVDATRKESGNLSYVLHQDVKEPLKYVIVEHWSSQEAIDLHNESAHFKTFVAEIEGKVESLDVSVFNIVY